MIHRKTPVLLRNVVAVSSNIYVKVNLTSFKENGFLLPCSFLKVLLLLL